MGSRLGIAKVAAKRLGITFDSYVEHLKSGLKHCCKCKKWKSRKSFGKDSTRHDGLDATCLKCRCKRRAPGPTIPERRLQAKNGLAWCSGCCAWKLISIVSRGKCRVCWAAYARKRYATNPTVRYKRRSHAMLRKRGVEDIPPEACEMLLEKFDGKCAYCDNQAETWDHVDPISKGETTRPGNIVPCCKSCNSSKRDKDVLEWIDIKGFKPHSALYSVMELGAMN
jgi:hypothetical protein